MDTFMDKLTQRKNAQEMIQANTAADTAKMEMMQRQMDEYDSLLQAMRKVNLKTAENMDLMQKAAQESIQKIQAIQENDEAQAKRDSLLEEIKKQMEALSLTMDTQKKEMAEIPSLLAKRIEEFSAETGKQVEKFAALSAETRKQAEALLAETRKQSEESSAETRKQAEGLLAETRKQIEEFSAESKKQMEEAFAKSDDFLHKENVKVYRNVQAAMTEELNKQTELIVGKQTESAGKQKALLPVSIITLLLVLADLFLRLFNIVIKL
ncbi:MAG: hypothetical protein NC419_00945 [Muribaculaceae bacterium]|nr:hypothetical protein [Muribaculaceae bacterium]